MAITTSSRGDQHEEQFRALAAIEPNVKAADQTWRRKYLREYTQAFRCYDRTLSPAELHGRITSASLILVGDYHALPACQKLAAGLVKHCADKKKRPVVLAVEAIFSRDQHILDEWQREEIGEQELRKRIRFDLDWGYDWEPFYELLSTARKHASSICALDCMPREDLRKINMRDRHAAHKLGEIRRRHPEATILALVGESHLAPTHLPALVAKELPAENRLTVLQNVDALYWQTSQETEDVRAVSVDDGTVCVFNSTPLEKYESYQRCLDRWRNEPDAAIDFAPAIYELINELFRALDIDRHSPRGRMSPKFLIDLLPEICGPCASEVRGSFARRGASRIELEKILFRLDQRGCVYAPEFNLFAIRKFQADAAAEEAARFVQHACQNLYRSRSNLAALSADDRRHLDIIEQSLVYLGAKMLWRLRQHDTGPNLASTSNVGTGLDQAHLRGDLNRGDLKRLFFFPIREPGKAAELSAHLHKRLHLRPDLNE